MARVQTREFKVYEHGGRNTEICKQFTRKIEEKGNCKVSVRTDIQYPSFLYVHEVTRVFHDIESALNSANTTYEHGGRNTEICEQFTKEIEEKGNEKKTVCTVHEATWDFHDIESALNSAENTNSYAAVVVFRKLTPYEKPDSSDLYSTPLPLGIPNELPIVACYWFEKNCKQQLCDCEENKKSVEKLVHLIKELQTDTASRSPGLFSGWWPSLGFRDLLNRSDAVGGQSSATAREPPKPEPLLTNPWREVEFSDDAYMKLQQEKIQNHQPHPKASTTNILISGSVGSGKSSFLNSVNSELRREELNGRVINIEAVRPGAQTSVTQHLRCYTFNDKIKIFDTAGFELEKTVNATIILKKIIDGEVAEGTKFDYILKTKCSMEGDKIHCVVLVISIHYTENLDPALIQFYEGLIGMLTETGVPCQLLVTFVDRLFEKTEDLKNLYRRRDIKQKIEKLAKKMRISMSNVLVISNYFEEMKINKIKGTLLLEAFAQILMAAKPFQERM